jgi:type III restriction enzyme
VVCDSKLELSIARELENNADVVSYAKNDRLFLEIPYRYLGQSLRYRPDFIVKLASGLTLLIEGKGREWEKDAAKLTAARRWVEAVNSWGKLGRWAHAMCWDAAEIATIVSQASAGGLVAYPTPEVVALRAAEAQPGGYASDNKE